MYGRVCGDQDCFLEAIRDHAKRLALVDLLKKKYETDTYAWEMINLYTTVVLEIFV